MAKPFKAPKIGRPKKFANETEFVKAIDEYFADAEEGLYTITGLGLAIGLSRLQIINYGKEEEFHHAVKKAKQLIEQDYEKSLRRHGRAGEIFGLKNFKWSDKVDIEHSGAIAHEHEGISGTHGILERFRGERSPQHDEDPLPN